MKKKKTGYYIDCIVHNQQCHKKICKKCGMHYCDEFYEPTCPDDSSDELAQYHPKKVERDAPLT